MSNLSVQQQQQLSLYLKKNPKISREKAIKLLFGGGAKVSSDKGLAVEHKKNSAQAQTIYLQSGRKVVYTRLKNGGLACKYYGADGTQLKPEYFKKVEGNISISADGTSYTITKNGKKSKPIKAKDAKLGVIDQNIVKLNNQEKRLKKSKKEQGFIGKGWDWLKNKTGIGDSSDKAQTQIDAERKLLMQMRKSGAKISKSEFEKITGQKCTPANMKKFQQGDFSQAAKKVSGYQEGQEMAVDVAADVVSGVAAFGIYTAAVASSPFTGGTSIALGVAAAAGTGALIKSGIKAADAFSGGRKYTFDNLKKDAGTGSVSGVLAPLTGGVGGAVGKTVATKFGLQTVKTVSKEIAEDVVENSFKQTLKTSLMSPGAFKYVGEGVGKKTLAYGSEIVSEGAVYGGIDSGARTAINGGSFSDVMQSAKEGALTAPIFGGLLKGTGYVLSRGVGKNFVKKGVEFIEEKLKTKSSRTQIKDKINSGNKVYSGKQSIPSGKLGASDFWLDEAGQVHFKPGRQQPKADDRKLLGYNEDGIPIFKGDMENDKSLSNIIKKIKQKLLTKETQNINEIGTKIGQPIKVDLDKIKIEKTQFSVNFYDEFGNSLGDVQYTISNKNVLKFEGLHSYVEGCGIGTKLINELKKIAQSNGCNKICADASPSTGAGNRPLTNIPFYYKVGFKATNPETHKQILDCLNNNKPIPYELNFFTHIELDV